MDQNSASARSLESEPKLPPLDLSHHYSVTTKARAASQIKKYYKFFQIPGIGNLAGGLPNPQFFPFDTLEAQAAKPQRWKPTPNDPVTPDALADRLAANNLASAPNAVPASRSGFFGFGGSSDSKKQQKQHDEDKANKAATHMTVPMVDPRPNPFDKIDLTTALQYGTAEGYPPLLAFIRQFTRENLHPNVPYAGGPEVILTCGSTDGMAKSLELLTDPWDPKTDAPEDRPHILTEKYIYMNALNQAAPRGIRPVPVDVDSDGMVVHGKGGLEDILKNWNPKDGQRPKLMYTVTMGHNPTGGVLPVYRRKEIYALCKKYDIIIVEDDPYWHLQYPSAEAEEAVSRGIPGSLKKEPAYKPAKSSGYEFLDSLVPSYLSMDTDGRVIRLDTFSKTIAPGCRLGWITAQPSFIERFARITETTTQQPSGFVQSMVAELLIGPQKEPSQSSTTSSPDFQGWDTSGWVRWLAGLRGAYERRMTTMARILDEGSHQLKQSTPVRDDLSDWGVISKTRLYTFDWPRGGMFLWLRVNFENHPLWMARGETAADLPVVDGPALGTALMVLCMQKPHLVLGAPGAMFAADDEVRGESAWAYMRLCFAAISDEEVEACSKRFVGAVHKFWRIKSVREIAELVDEFRKADVKEAEETEGMGNLMSMGVC